MCIDVHRVGLRLDAVTAAFDIPTGELAFHRLQTPITCRPHRRRIDLRSDHAESSAGTFSGILRQVVLEYQSLMRLVELRAPFIRQTPSMHASPPRAVPVARDVACSSAGDHTDALACSDETTQHRFLR